MKTTILLLLLAAGLSAQSLAVTSPANGSVVTWGFPLTAAPTSLPSLTQVRFYIDGRMECIVNAKYLGGWSCPKMYNATYSDERAATIYAEAYNAVGAKIATSSTNTFRLNNTGVNAVTAFNFGGLVAKGATISGSGTFTLGSNATLPAATSNWNVDGIGGFSPVQAAAPLGSNVNTSTGAVTGFPTMPFHNGDLVGMNCVSAAMDAGSGCAGAGGADLPVLFQSGGPFYVIVCGPGCYQFSATPGGSAIVPSTQGTTGEYLKINLDQQQCIARGASFTVDTTCFQNGLHRFEQVLMLPGGAYHPTGTFTFPASSINAGTGIVAATNFPLVQGQIATCSGTCPSSQWTGILYTQVQDADHFCFASSVSGSCIGSLTGANGTLTITFTVPATFLDTTDTNNGPLLGTDINEFTFSNGSAPQALRTKYSKIAGIAGDTFTLAPYYLNCDGSTTALSASHPVYLSSDATRATVSSTGVVTLGSTTGHALISVVDALSSTTGRNVDPIDVEVRADRTTFNHFSAGHGILANYTAGQSRAIIECFTCGSGVLLSNPFPKKYLQYAFNTMQGGPNFLTPLDPGTGEYAGSYSNWYNTIWSATTGPWYNYSLAAVIANAAAIAPIRSYGAAYGLCHGFAAYNLYHTAWVQQAFSKIMNDVAPYVDGWEHCDEQTGKFGTLQHPRGDMGSGQDGLGNSTLGGMTAGLTSVTISGCAATPCAATATIHMRSRPSWLGETYGGGAWLQIQGATTCAQLNGPISATSPVYAYDDPLGHYVVSFTATVYDITNQTCTDAGIVITSTSEGNDYGSPYVSTTGHVSAGNVGLGYQFGEAAGPSQTSCVLNVCTFTWAAHPFTFTGQIAQLVNYGTSGLSPYGISGGTAGWWRVTVINANSFSIRVASVANGTYTSGTDTNGVIDAMGYLPQTFVPSLYANPIFTGASPPRAGSLTGGLDPGMYSYASWQGKNSTTDYVAQNNSFAGQTPDRYGSPAYFMRNIYRAASNKPLVDGSLPINLVPDAKPFLYETPATDECQKIIATLDCHTDQTPGDKIDNQTSSGGNLFLFNILVWLLPNTAGQKIYQYDGWLGFQRVGIARPNGLQYYQVDPNEVDLYPERWLGWVSATGLVQHEDKYLLAPPLSSPDQNQGPGPYTQIECQSHKASYGSAMLCVNLSEETQTATFDLSVINPGGAGGPMRRWNLSAFGDTVTSLSPSTTSDAQTLLYAQAVLYVSQTAGTTDDLKPIKLPVTPAYGATKAVLEIHYYPNDQAFQTVDCGAGACPSIPVNLHNLDVYVRKRFTKTDGTPVMVGDFEKVAAQ